MTRPLMHPNLLTRLRPSFFVTTCTVQANTPSRTSLGEQTDSWANVTGLVDLACSLAPVGVTTQRTPMGIWVNATHRLLLSGYYSTIQTKHSVVIAGTRYAIEGVEHDSQQTMTRLALRLVAS